MEEAFITHLPVVPSRRDHSFICGQTEPLHFRPSRSQCKRAGRLEQLSDELRRGHTWKRRGESEAEGLDLGHEQHRMRGGNMVSGADVGIRESNNVGDVSSGGRTTMRDADDGLPDGRGKGSDAVREADESASVASSRRPEEEAVLSGTQFRDGRYGTCFQCGGFVVIPGLATFYCEQCRWVARPVETETIAPGHHD